MVSFPHEQNISCNHTQLNDIAHEQTIICLQLFAGHVVGSRPMKRKKNLDRMIITFESSAMRSGTSYSGKIITALSCMPLNMIQRETER